MNTGVLPQGAYGKLMRNLLRIAWDRDILLSRAKLSQVRSVVNISQ